MTQSTYPAKLTKKLAHNLEHVADELVTYISELNSVRELVKHSHNAKLNYYGSWLMHILVYRWTRQRSPEFDALIASLNQSGNAITLMEAFDQFLSSGGEFSTSANTRLLTELVLGLPGYADTREDFSLTESNLQDIRKMVLLRTEKILRPVAEAATAEIQQQDALKKQQLEQAELLELQKKLEADAQRIESESLYKLDLLKKIELEKELQHLPRRNIKQAAHDLAETTRFLIKRNAVGKLDQNKFGALQTELNGLYHNVLVKKGIIKPDDIQSKQAVKGGAMKNKVGKLKKDFLEDMNNQLGGMLKAAATDYHEKLKMEEKVDKMYEAAPSQPATPPSSPAQLCAAAFEAPVVSSPITGKANELVFNSEQAAAMFSIFGSAQKVKIKPPKQHDPDSTASPIASR